VYTHVPYVLYTRNTCADPMIMIYTASRKRRPDHPRPRTGYGGNPSSVFRTPTPCNDTLRETANGARLGKNFTSLNHPALTWATQRLGDNRGNESSTSTSHRLRRWTVFVAAVRLRILCEESDFMLPEPGQTSHALRSPVRRRQGAGSRP
jgi:hypothetical protein